MVLLKTPTFCFLKIIACYRAMKRENDSSGTCNNYTNKEKIALKKLWGERH